MIFRKFLQSTSKVMKLVAKSKSTGIRGDTLRTIAGIYFPECVAEGFPF